VCEREREISRPTRTMLGEGERWIERERGREREGVRERERSRDPHGQCWERKRDGWRERKRERERGCVSERERDLEAHTDANAGSTRRGEKSSRP